MMRKLLRIIWHTLALTGLANVSVIAYSLFYPEKYAKLRENVGLPPHAHPAAPKKGKQRR